MVDRPRTTTRRLDGEVEVEVEVEASEVLIVKLDPAYARSFVQRAQTVVVRRPPAVSVLRQPARPRGAPVPARQRVQARCRLSGRRPCSSDAEVDDDPDPRRARARGSTAVGASNASFFGRGHARRSVAPVHLQAGHGGAAAVGLPGRHPGRPRARRPAGLRGRRLGRRAADGAARRPASGPGMCQQWIEIDRTHDLVDVVPTEFDDGRLDRDPRGRGPARRTRSCSCIADDDRLRDMAVLDVVINNADRKGGHVLWSTHGGTMRRVCGLRPRGLVPRRRQAAHRAVGLGRRAASRQRPARVLDGSATRSRRRTRRATWRAPDHRR